MNVRKKLEQNIKKGKPYYFKHTLIHTQNKTKSIHTQKMTEKKRLSNKKFQTEIISSSPQKKLFTSFCNLRIALHSTNGFI